MTTISYNQPIDSYDLNDWLGSQSQVTFAGSGLIRLTDGRHVTTMFGSFEYDTYGLTGGTLSSLSLADGNTPMFSISGLSLGIQETLSLSTADLQARMLSGDDVFFGSGGNDDFFGYTGNDVFYGRGGVDTVHYVNTPDNISISSTGSIHTVTDSSGKRDTLFDIERIGLGDGSTLALDVAAGQNAGSAYRIYQAAFDRTPDTAGLKFWTELLDRGVTLGQVAQGFVDSAEFKQLNPGSDPASLVNTYYQNVLHRGPDADGANFWVQAMNNGMNAATLLTAFSESQENIDATAAALVNGVWLV